ncbi:glycosyltransferase family 1 protein [Pedobacter chinensis]|uniref:Glycosyltransferase family 1 protein n=1 Tax=Pedobacter chinensis TaxID=2282421 RepID=A0A369PT49_9SPHI|nr:glycosyltransferase family 4 protein [Pedobacter chinensis]RDC55831.1 glycosyltransferase family 1 protein [Pedobacter chinensis]
MNILYVFGGEKAQGAEIVIERLMTFNHLSAENHLIIAPGSFANNLLSDKKSYKISVYNGLKKLNRSTTNTVQYYLKALKNYILVSNHVLEYIRQHQIDVVHANTMVPASYLLPALLFSRLTNRKVKWYWSDHDLRYFSKVDSWISKVCFLFYNKTLVVSQAVKRKFNNAEKAVVLYNGLDADAFLPDKMLRASFRAQNNIRENHIVIGLAAVISPDKGQLTLIQVFAQLLQEHANILLVLAGGYANDTPNYSDEVKEALAYYPDIKHLGYVNNMVTFYNGCDIIINNSSNYRSEPLGTTIYEAMACEKLVLASDTGGSSEIISDNVDGFLFQAENTQALLDKLRFVLANLNVLDKVRSRARQKVIDKFNVMNMVQHYNVQINNS